VSRTDSRNLAELAELALERRGDYDALFFEGAWHRSGELQERAARLAGGLADAGVFPGDRVLVLMENSPDVGVAYHGIWRAGAVAVPVMFLVTAEDLRAIVLDAEPTAALTSPAFRDTVEQACAGTAVRMFLAGEHDAAAPGAIVSRADHELAALVYTGGTTGRAKGVMLTHANIWEAGRRGQEAGEDMGVVRGLTSLPLAHVYGLLVLAVGLHEPEPPETVLMRWFDAAGWLALAQEHRTQIAAVVPSMIHLLLQQPLEDYDLSELRFLVSGAAPLPTEAIAELQRRLPALDLREGYGLTESCGLVSSNPPGRARPGTVGLAAPGVEVRIVDDEGNDTETGEVLVRSETVTPGYWNAPELTAETIREGWLHTGDIGRIDADGYLTIVDRKKDLIIRGGFNVYPRDVEEALLEHPAISSASVVGRPDPVHGEEVVAFVTLAADATPEELVAFGRERLGGYKYPREVHILPTLPLTPVGKTDRKALRALLPGIRTS
jgi:long-chain acyl-CoA synthetase